VIDCINYYLLLPPLPPLLPPFEPLLPPAPLLDGVDDDDDDEPDGGAFCVGFVGILFWPWGAAFDNPFCVGELGGDVGVLVGGEVDGGIAGVVPAVGGGCCVGVVVIGDVGVVVVDVGIIVGVGCV
jgi:hypothetical protein